MSSKASLNLIQATTQVRMMLETDVPLLKERGKRRPTKVFLCISGKINERARRYIVEDIKSPHIEFRDSDDLIPEIDRLMPEFWLGVAANKSPYLTALHASLTDETESGFGHNDIFWCPADGVHLIQLRFNRMKLITERIRGEFHTEEVTRTKFEELSAEQLLETREQLILIVGGAGDGKTTTLRRLASELAETSMADIENANIPILVRAVDLAANIGDLIEYLSQHTVRVSSTSEPAFDLNDLEQGRVTLFVDGLDEIPDQQSRQALIADLTAFSSLYSPCRVILTSRNYLWLEELSDIGRFEQFRISPIHWRQAEKLIKRVQKNKSLPQEQTSEILRRLQEVHGMELNPLIVTIFLASSDAQKTDIPANITELFKKFTEQMLGRWDESKGFKQQYQAPLKDFLLQHIAVRMHKEQLTSIPLESLKSVLREELEKRGQEAQTDILVDEIVQRSGFFRILGDQIEFRHLMLQEFFAGRGLRAGEIELLIEDSWWQRCIVFYFGENPDQQEVLENVTKSLEELEGMPLMQAALTLGLALQACYLLTLDEKTILYSDVIEAMGRATKFLYARKIEAQRLPMTEFISEYIIGRDSTPCNVLKGRGDEIFELLQQGQLDTREYTQFWHIVGLMESGLLEEAFEHVKAFDPVDRRCLLSLHLGSILYEHTRVSTRSEKVVAQQIQRYLKPKVDVLRDALLKEFKSEILELRRGKIEALPDTRPSQTEVSLPDQTI